MKSENYEQQRLRSVHLSIIVMMTISALAITASGLSLGWREVWMFPLIIAGTAASWVLHIRQLFTEEARVWFYAIIAWMVLALDGVKTTSLFDFSVTFALCFAMFSQTNERKLLHISLVIYLFLLCIHIAQIRAGNSVTPDVLVWSQIAMHAACALLVYLIGLNIITKREKDSENARQVIAELVSTRRRTENFMANVSHELRTPVNVVTGLSSVMAERLSDTQNIDDALHIHEAGKRLSDQVDDILDFTEIETGQLMIAEEPYSIVSVMNDVLVALGVYTLTDLPEIVVDLDANVPQTLMGDGRRIKKVIYHLADNAVKFTESGGVLINVYEMPQDYGINLCIDVRDTGIGMSRETIERVREGIYQEDAERNRAHSGFGLGMRIVFGIVHAMGGFVRMESEEGKGTHIHASIPQGVRGTEKCMTVQNPGALKVALFQKTDKFEPPEVERYYMQMIQRVINAFHLTLQHVTTPDDCKQLLADHTFTHLFVPDAEYSEDPAYFDALCDHMHVVLVAGTGFTPSPFSKVTILRKPLYAVPLVEVLNAASAEDAKAALSGGEEVRLDGMKVLVVDDEEMNLVVARGIFTGYGMEVETALSGAESIEKVRGKDYDLIFMDHMMPVMDGVEAAHRIRDVLQTSGRKTKIVALTANAVSGAREMFMKEGFDGFVAKPIERTELLRAIKKIAGTA